MNRGFTLVEILIYLGIIGTIATSLIFFSFSVSDARSKTYAVSEVNANARVVTEILSSYIYHAEDVLEPLPGFSSNVLVLMMPAPQPPVTISLVDGVLYFLEDGGTPMELTAETTRVAGPIEFLNLSKAGERDNIRFSFTLEFPSDKDFYSKLFRTAVSTRP